MDIPLFEKKAGYIECKLCPHRCRLKSGEVGKCSVRKCNGVEIYLSNFGMLSHVAVEPIEKKPFYSFLPKTKTLSIGGLGCSLRCQFCENHQTSQVEKSFRCKMFCPDELVSLAHKKHCSSICMTFNEPTISYEFLRGVANECRQNDLKFIIKTNAYINQEPWQEICKVVDAVNIDWKGSEIQYKTILGAGAYVIKERIREAYEAGVHLEVSIPLYYSFIDDIRIFFQCGAFLNSIDENIHCHLLKVIPSYKMQGHVPITKEQVQLAYHILSFYMNNVHLHN